MRASRMRGGMPETAAPAGNAALESYGGMRAWPFPLAVQTQPPWQSAFVLQSYSPVVWQTPPPLQLQSPGPQSDAVLQVLAGNARPPDMSVHKGGDGAVQ
jgi:hypothetical protein